MDADSFSLDEDGFERLDAEAVERGSAIEQHRMLANHFLEDVPNDGVLLLDHFLRLLDRRAVPLRLETVIDKRLEQLERHLLRQAALMQLQLGADDDDRTSGVVDA